MPYRSASLLLAAVVASAAAAQPPADPTVEDKVRELFRAGRYDDALKELQAKANPKRSPPRVALANLFYQSGNGQNARLYLEAAAAEDPRHPEVYLLNASFAFAEGRMTDLILNAQAAVQLAADPRWDPDQRRKYVREGRLGLSAGYESRRDWSAVRDQCAAMLADDPKNGPTRQRLASAVYHLGRPDEAYQEFSTARRDDPAVDLPELRMSAMSAADGNAAKAEEWLKKAVTSYPQDAGVSRAYTGWLLDAGDVNGAEKMLEAAAKTDPTGRDTQVLRGLIARHRKDYAAAESIFETLCREHPGDAVAAWNLALVLADGGKPDKQRRAVELAEAEVRRTPRSPEANAILGWCFYKIGRTDDADRRFNEAAQSGPLSRDAAYFIGRVLADKKQWAAASQVLKLVMTNRGAAVYKPDAERLLAEVESHLPKADEPKKP